MNNIDQFFDFLFVWFFYLLLNVDHVKDMAKVEQLGRCYGNDL